MQQLNFGMPYGFAEALALKYGIMQQQAAAQAKSLISSAGLDDVKARLLPGQTAAEIADTQARTAGQLETNKTIVPESTARQGLYGSQAKNYDATSANTNEETVGLKLLNKPRPFGLGLNKFTFGS